MHPGGAFLGKTKMLSLYRIKLGVNGEVKTRTVTIFGTPAAAVTYMKQQKIKKTALTWLQSQERYFPGLSFDVIEILVKENTARIRWLQHCF